MAVMPLILDRPIRDDAATPSSVLDLPMGGRMFLDELTAMIDTLPERMSREILVLTDNPDGEDYPVPRKDHAAPRNGNGHAVKRTSAAHLHSLLSECEATDNLLVMDPTRWPMEGLNWADILDDRLDRGEATHWIAVEGGDDGIAEHIERDPAGQVRRIQRLYDAAARPDVAGRGIFLSMVPARSIRGSTFASLWELRCILSTRGILTRDVPLITELLDLTASDGALTINERRLKDQFRGKCPPGFMARGADVRIGPNCRIHDSARIIGPIVLHQGVTVEEGATLVGPTVVGPHSHIRQGAIVIQSVLTGGSEIARGATVRHRVVSGRWTSSGTELGATVELPHPALDSNAWRRTNHWGTPKVPRRDHLKRKFHLNAKRVMDVVLSLAALAVLAPLLIVVAIWIKADSPGPVLFIHQRERKGGKKFPCLKFRTMVSDAHLDQRALYQQNDIDGPQFKLRHDPRLTRFGRWVRNCNIDELPQLLNVLVGHMSLVGPRPSPERENQICVAWRRARLSVPPGITGLWQLCRSDDRSAEDFQEWIFYDVAYIRHFSIWLDIKILAATMLTLGGRRRVPMSLLIREDGGHFVASDATVA